MKRLPQFVELDRFPVEVKPHSEVGMLYPDRRSGDLLLRSPLAEQLDFQLGGNIAALLVFDIDASGVIGEVEVLVPPERWKRGDRPMSDVPTTAGVLSVPRIAREIVVDELVPSFVFDERNGVLLIRVEPLDERTTSVELSNECSALVNDGFLAGFLVSLPPSGGGVTT
jgi:hypothetical protein